MTNISIILLALFLVQLHNIDAAPNVLKESHIHLDKDFVFNTFTYIDEKLTYALCDKPGSKSERKCTVIRQKNPYQSDTYSCDVTLKSEGEISKKIGVVPFGNDKAILIWAEEKQNKAVVKLTTVQLADCKVGETTISPADDEGGLFFYPVNKVDIVDRGDTYDVFYKNPENCNQLTCKLTVDVDGKIISGPASAMGEVGSYARQNIFAVDSSGKDYFYLKREKPSEYAYALWKSDASEKILEKLVGVPFDDFIAMSKSNDLVGSCYSTGKEIKCSQFGPDGSVKIQKTLADYPKFTFVGGLHNTAGGGFLLLMTKNNRYFVDKFDATGNKVGTLDMKEFECDGGVNTPTVRFYEDTSKKICASMACLDTDASSGRKDGKGHVDLYANCFTDSDFSM